MSEKDKDVDAPKSEILVRWEKLKAAMIELDNNPIPATELEATLRKSGRLSFKSLFKRLDR